MGLQDDLKLIREALYSGQISAAKVDAQRALHRLESELGACKVCGASIPGWAEQCSEHPTTAVSAVRVIPGGLTFTAQLAGTVQPPHPLGHEIREFIAFALSSADDAGPRGDDAEPALEELANFVWLIENMGKAKQ